MMIAAQGKFHEGFGPALSGVVPNLPPPPPDMIQNPQTLYQWQVQSMQQWYSSYYQTVEAYTKQVIDILRQRGFAVQILQTPDQLCNPSAGCHDHAGYNVTLTRDGFTSTHTVGGRQWAIRYNSAGEEADMHERVFEDERRRATGVSASPYAPGSSVSYSNIKAELRAPYGTVVGKRFALVVAGAPPNQPVSVAAKQTCNGQTKDHGKTQYGATDAGGYFALNGTFGPEHVGSWSEQIYVGGQKVKDLWFEVTGDGQCPMAPQQQTATSPFQAAVSAPAPQQPAPEPPPPNTVASNSYTITATGQAIPEAVEQSAPAYTQTQNLPAVSQPSAQKADEAMKEAVQTRAQVEPQGSGMGVALLAAAGIAALLLLGGGGKD